MINIDLSLLASGFFDIRITKDKLYLHTHQMYSGFIAFKVTTSFRYARDGYSVHTSSILAYSILKKSLLWGMHANDL